MFFELSYFIDRVYSMLDYFKIQSSIEYTVNKFSDVKSSKPTLLHSIRCGMKLMNDGFNTELIIAGVLHDTIEDTTANKDEISEIYGNNVARIVAANTKDPAIKDPNERREELIIRCCLAGRSALIVKLSDIYDNYTYYKAIDDKNLINYCLELKSYIEKHIKDIDSKDEYIAKLLSEIA